jgi:nucleotide sugar dehydrogenase
MVIMASVVGVGFTENEVRELLENTSGLKVGVNLGLAYCGSWTSPKGRLKTTANEQLIVAATDKTSLQIASAVMETILSRNVRNTESMKMAEAATLFDIARWNVNVALSNEFALFCEKAGIDYTEVDKLALANSTETLPTLVNPDAQTGAYFLFENAEDLSMTLRISKAAVETNEEIASHVINLARDALRNCGKTLRRARVTVLGVSGTPNMRDTPRKAVEELVKTLESKGARVSLYDPFISADELLETQGCFKRTLNEALEGIDCIIISTGHDQFKRLSLKKLKAIMKTPAAIIDLEGIMEPDKIEKEGFTYRRLGRGTIIK